MEPTRLSSTAPTYTAAFRKKFGAKFNRTSSFPKPPASRGSKTLPIEVRDPLTSIRLKHGTLISSGAKNDVRIKILHALNQLNDSDARCAGLKLVHRVVDTMDAKLIPLFLECLYPLCRDQKPLCRKEFAALFSYLATKRGDDPLFQKHVHKMCANLAKRCHDSDARVRDACGEAFAHIANRALAHHKPEKAKAVLNKILLPISKVFQSNDPNAFSGGLVCLRRVIGASNEHICHHLESIVVTLGETSVKTRSSKAHADLLLAIQTLVLVTGRHFLTEYMSVLIGIVLDAMSSTHWCAREAAIQALEAVGVKFNHDNAADISVTRDEILAHLERLKFDKVSTVRKSAIHALTVWRNDPTKENEDDFARLLDHEGTDEQFAQLEKEFRSSFAVGVEPAGEMKEKDDLSDHESDLSEVLGAPVWYENPTLSAATLNSAPLASTQDRPSSPRKSIADPNDIGNDSDIISLQFETNSNSNRLHTAPVDTGVSRSERSQLQKDTMILDKTLHRQVLQQQQLMIQSVKHLEDWMKREMTALKTRIHSVEREISSLKRSDSNTRRPQLHTPNIEFIRHNDSDADDTTVTSENGEQIADLNERLWQMLHLDSNLELVRWLDDNSGMVIFDWIDYRLIVTLLFRLLHMMKNGEYLSQISKFFQGQFLRGVPPDFCVPTPLRKELVEVLPGIARDSESQRSINIVVNVINDM